MVISSGIHSRTGGHSLPSRLVSAVDDYIVWDKSAAIDFVRPGRGRVAANFAITDDDLQTIRQNTANGEKYLPHFSIRVLDEEGEMVARIKKVLYVRKKEHKP
jgi:hypothetical protein